MTYEMIICDGVDTFLEVKAELFACTLAVKWSLNKHPFTAG